MAIRSLGEFFEWLGNLGSGKSKDTPTGSMEKYDEKNGGVRDGYYFGKLWDDITGKTNTWTQNSAASALQEDAQQHQLDMLKAESAASLDYAQKLPGAQVQGLMDAGLNPWLAAGNGYSGSMSSSSAGIANPQASNVSALQSIANTAVTAGMVIKIMKMLK